jgi:CxxC motif-containing protein
MMKETKTLTCIGCPLGCPLAVDLEDGKVLKVTGQTCKRGEDYAKKEVTNPRRTLTSILPVVGGELDMVSVKTKTDIPKPKIMDCMLALKNLKVNAPVAIGDVIIPDICGTGVSVVATKSVRKRLN